MNAITRPVLLFGITIFTLVFLLPPGAVATPYASGISNNAGTVSFTLNESADNVTVSLDGGASTLDLGALPAGRHSFSLGAATTFAIQVSKSGPATWTQISSDSALIRFYVGVGVAVNTFPSSPYFGRIYVANATAGTTTVGPEPHRSSGDGIYILNADLTDGVGQGDTARTAGLNFAPATQPGNTPWRIEVGKDDRLYIADYSTATGNIYRTDPDVTTGEAVFDGQGTTGNPAVHTTIGALRIFGRLEDGDLEIVAIDGNTTGSLNTIKRWSIGSGPLPWATAPTTMASVFPSVAQLQSDLDISSDGKFFTSVNRFDGTDTDSVRVYDTDGTTLLFGSRTVANLAGITPDPLRQTRGIRISPDGRFLASITDSNGIVITRLTNGIPDIGSMQVLPIMGGTNRVGREVCFDAAGNLYALSSGLEVLRVFSPGGTATATTSSDGTFNLETVPLPDVSVSAIDSAAAESGPDTGTITFTRTGDLTQPLTANFTVSGTATSGSDYDALSASVTFLANEATATLTVTPIDDSAAEATETVVVSLVASGEYLIASPSSATVVIVDNEYPNVLSITATDTNIYERTPQDTATFTITRLGDTNIDLFVDLTFSGAAQVDIDFMGPSFPLIIPAGTLSMIVTIVPVDDQVYEGDETLTISIPSTPDYVPGTAGSATVRIRENEYPPATVLFSDDLNFDTSHEWTTVFGANNDIFDATVTFAHEYSGIPPAPATVDGTTTGLFVSVNKDATASAAAVNLYPTGRSFRGNYALRFDALLTVGTASTTEHMLAGINHSGQNTNRVRQSGTPPATTHAVGADGVWFAVVTDASNLRDYAAYSSTNSDTLPWLIATRTATSMARFIPAPPFRAPGGSPANTAGSGTPTWAEFEVSQIGNVVALKVNHVVAIQLTNTTAFTNGNIMIGHNDAYDSTGSAATSVIFDNVRVVSLDLAISNLQLLPNNTAQFDFVSPLGGVAGDFVIESTATLSAPAWAQENSAVISTTANGFRAVVPVSGNARFYRVRK